MDIGDREGSILVDTLSGAGGQIGGRRADLLSPFHNVQVGADVHVPLDVAMVQPHPGIVRLREQSGSMRRASHHKIP